MTLLFVVHFGRPLGGLEGSTAGFDLALLDRVHRCPESAGGIGYGLAVGTELSPRSPGSPLKALRAVALMSQGGWAYAPRTPTGHISLCPSSDARIVTSSCSFPDPVMFFKRPSRCRVK